MAHTQRFFAVLAAALWLAACAGNSGTLPASHDTMPLALNRPDAKPPACAGQSATSEYATGATQTIASKPGSLCVPAFGGFGGAIQFPAAKPSMTGTATSSTTNYNQTLPTLFKTGKPLFYLQVVTSGPSQFGKKIKATGGFDGKSLKPGNYYTIFGEAKFAGVAGITSVFTPCIAKATAGKYGGLISGIGTLLAAQRMDSQAVMYFEIYAGKHAKTPC